ncbi:hypothetical protein WJT86_10720 [Microvirga sp. W0021]|uniref:Uncharacterized protein n=1 Tax=Hohaiivirga grylli TaxID=3133970 RepID=A0ABV0BKL0_9HYPH
MKSKILTIFVTFLLVATTALLSVFNWNGWLSDERYSNRIINLLANMQRWMVETLGSAPTAAIFAAFSLFILWGGIQSLKEENNTEPSGT